MTSFNLDQALSGHVFAYLLVFTRLGTMLMLFPGIGEAYVPARVRLMFAMAICFLLVGPLLPRLPALPAQIPDLVTLLVIEAAIGIFFGTLLRLVVSALEAAGSIVGLQTGLSNATILNPALATQSPLPSAFLSVAGVTLLFVTGVDHLLMRSLVSIYDVFPPGDAPILGDMIQATIQAVNTSFVIGVQMAMPFFVMGLLMYVSMGIMQKLLPQVQLFLVALPAQIWGGLALLMFTITGILAVWLRYMDDTIKPFVR